MQNLPGTRGLEVYRSCTKVIVLTKCHRLKTVANPSTDAEREYNARALRFVQTLRRLRDLRWTMDDYFWLCERKRSKLSFSERARFEDAPIIMDFHRQTDAHPEENCECWLASKTRTYLDFILTCVL